MRISLIVARTVNGVIGREGSLPWHISEDLKHFKSTTMGKPIIMGRKTWESIGRPLPGRINIVVSRDSEYRADGAIVMPNLDKALLQARATRTDEVVIIGGAQIYNEALMIADRIYLTEIAAEYEGDTYFPELNADEWHEVSREAGEESPQDGVHYEFVILERESNGDAA